MAATTRSAAAKHERASIQRAELDAPDQDPSMTGLTGDVERYEGQAGTSDSEEATLQDWIVADRVRPDMDGETTDGLSEIEEEVRHAAEDLPSDDSWEHRVRQKAYELWESEGGPHGRSADHWHIAAQLVAEEDAHRSDLFPYEGDIDQPVEEASMLDNLGEFPGLTDQGEDSETEEDDQLRRSEN